MCLKFKKSRKSYLAVLLVIMGVSLFLLSFGPIIYSEAWYYLKQAKNQKMYLDTGSNVGNGDTAKNGAIKDSVFARFLSSKPILVEPVNRDFSIVIEKIGVNAPVVPNISIADQNSYADALKSGVAHAINSDKPSKNPGNTYIFAHASLNFWELGKYATTFNLLRKLEVGDIVNVFYKNNLYEYKVINIEKYDGWNVYPITRPVIMPVLTLQTCDPPGTTLNRLVVTAELDRVLDL